MPDPVGNIPVSRLGQCAPVITGKYFQNVRLAITVSVSILKLHRSFSPVNRNYELMIKAKLNATARA